MPERDGTLLILAHRLRSLGPPSLSVLIACLEEAEEYEHFVALVREFLPEWEREILGRATPSGQIAAFADRFEDRYFPLRDDMRGQAEGYSDLTRGIPVVVMGLSPDDYHDIASAYRLGLQLMTYLLEDPFEGEFGARVALAEACQEHVPRELLLRVPQGGLPQQEAHRLLDGTPYRGLALWADILTNDTGNFFLDVSGEELWEDMPTWEREVVEELTRDWLQADEMWGTVLRLAEWLEENPPARFGELLDFVERRRDGNGAPN